MGQKSIEPLTVFPFLTAAAFLAGIHQTVIGDLHFISAITAAVPDYRTALIISSGGIAGSKAAKSLPGYIRIRIILRMGLAWAAGPPAGDQQCTKHLIRRAAGTFAQPHGTSVLLFGLSLPDHGKLPKLFSGQVR